MTHLAGFDTFMRKTFGADPAAIAGRSLEAIAHEHTLQAGDLVPLDQSKGHIAYVYDGATKLAAYASEGRQQIVAFHFVGDVISIPRDGPHSFALTALRPTQLLTFPARTFVKNASRDERIAYALLEHQRNSLHRCRDAAVALGKKNARERICCFLLSMSERAGAGEAGQTEIDLTMTRRDIGDALGLTIETVSRQLSNLREEGLIATVGRSKVRLLNEKEIAKGAGHFQNSEPETSNSRKFDLDQCSSSRAALTRSAEGVSS